MSTTKRRDKPTQDKPIQGDVATTPKGSRTRNRLEKVTGSAPDAEDTPSPVPPQPMIRSITGTAIDPVSLLFDADWYRVQYPDVAAAGLDPIRHFFDNGAREGRNPNAYFETNWYVSTNADVAASMMNPFLHYLLYGAREGRKGKP